MFPRYFVCLCGWCQDSGIPTLDQYSACVRDGREGNHTGLERFAVRNDDESWVGGDVWRAPGLAVAADQGSDGFAAMNFMMFGPLALNVDRLEDPAHGVHNDLLLSIKASGRLCAHQGFERLVIEAHVCWLFLGRTDRSSAPTQREAFSHMGRVPEPNAEGLPTLPTTDTDCLLALLVLGPS